MAKNKKNLKPVMTIDDYYIKKTNPVFRVLIYIFLAFWLVVNLSVCSSVKHGCLAKVG